MEKLTKKVTFNMTDDLHQKLKMQAVKEHTNVSRLLSTLVREHIQEYNDQHQDQ